MKQITTNKNKIEIVEEELNKGLKGVETKVGNLALQVEHTDINVKVVQKKLEKEIDTVKLAFDSQEDANKSLIGKQIDGVVMETVEKTNNKRNIFSHQKSLIFII